MTNKPAPRDSDVPIPEGGMTYIVLGLLMAIIGGVALEVGRQDETSVLVYAGVGAIVLGSVMLNVGVVASGVEVALRRFHHPSRSTNSD